MWHSIAHAARRTGSPGLVATALVFALVPAGASAQAELVQVVGERSALAGCALLGEVRGSSLVGILIENQGWERAVDEMRETALALGATHLLLHGVERTATGSQGRGDAYGCPLGPVERPAPRGRRGR